MTAYEVKIAVARRILHLSREDFGKEYDALLNEKGTSYDEVSDVLSNLLTERSTDVK